MCSTSKVDGINSQCSSLKNACNWCKWLTVVIEAFSILITIVITRMPTMIVAAIIMMNEGRRLNEIHTHTHTYIQIN